MTTPLDPQVREVLRAAVTRVRAVRDTAGTAGLFPACALLVLLVTAVILASTVPAVPAGPVATVGMLVLAAAVVVCVETWCARAAAAGRERLCGLQDASGALLCDLPAGHTGVHLDARDARAFAETPDIRSSDAGAHPPDGRGRAVPLDDVF